MNTSDNIDKIAPALLQAQRAITFAAKEAKNPHFKNTYADLPAVIDAVKPALNTAGIVFLQFAEPGSANELRLTTRLLHESGQWIEATATCPLTKADPQGFGSGVSYARRYCLAAAVGLYQDDDDGNAASRPAHREAAPVAASAELVARAKEAAMQGKRAFQTFFKTLAPADRGSLEPHAESLKAAYTAADAADQPVRAALP